MREKVGQVETLNAIYCPKSFNKPRKGLYSNITYNISDNFIMFFNMCRKDRENSHRLKQMTFNYKFIIYFIEIAPWYSTQYRIPKLSLYFNCCVQCGF